MVEVKVTSNFIDILDRNTLPKFFTFLPGHPVYI
jgi:hypothetical protein